VEQNWWNKGEKQRTTLQSHKRRIELKSGTYDHQQQVLGGKEEKGSVFLRTWRN